LAVVFLVDISKGDFTGLAHKVLDILPAHAMSEIFDNQTVLGSLWGAESAIVSVLAAISSITTSKLDNESLSHKLFSVEVVDSILGISVIAKLNKAESVFEGDLTESAVAFEEGFDITVGGISGETTQVHTG